MTPMCIGIDLDNTLIGYDRLFPAVAADLGLLPAGFRGGKAAVRGALRALPEGEARWRLLQAEVYGPRLDGAELLPGAEAFLADCRRAAIPVQIVSHKTTCSEADPLRTDLRAAALRFLEARDLLDPQRYGLSPERVHFLETRAAKLACIGALDLTHFIDDLAEVLGDPDFPPGVRRVLLGHGPAPAGVRVCRTWGEVRAAVLGDVRPDGSSSANDREETHMPRASEA